MRKNYDIQAIMEFLPHRYPFILIDRVIKLVPGRKVLALKNVTINEPFFQGHFPGRPIMPGVLIIEALGQAGGIISHPAMQDKNSDLAMYFMGMDRVRFRKPVVPGDQLILDVKILQQRSKVFKMAGKATVDNVLVAEAEFLAMIGDKK
ncbi:MAG: 3-hydroxyacyl-ACP dehydratase FabZ [Deltaproteobacteria bacterium]|nr:3-hydroxyacyl-ACP dehydratase FabZ [Deltaproteobacteria bacterium]